MSLDELLDLLNARNIKVTATDRLHIQAPKGVVDAELRQALTDHKEGLLTLLTQSAALKDTIVAIDGDQAQMTVNQRSIYLDYKINPASRAFDMLAVIQLKGQPDYSAMSQALQTLVKHNDTLRSRYFQLGGGFYQAIVDGYYLPVGLIRSQDLNEAIAEFAAQRFNLEQANVFKASLLAVNDQLGYVLLNIHHIAADGWSLELLKKQLFEHYCRIVQGRKDEPTSQKTRYLDYARWLSNRHAAARENDEQFWQRYLADLQCGPQLQLAPAGNEDIRPIKARYICADAVNLAVDSLVRRYQCSPYQVWLALYKALLFRYSGSPDVVIVSPMIARDRPELQLLTGLLLDSPVIRTRMDVNLTLDALVHSVAADTVAVKRHHSLTFNDFLRICGIDAGSNDNPLMRYSLNMLSYPRQDLCVPGLDVTFLEPPTTQSKYDLTLYITPEEGRYELLFHFNGKLFDNNAIDIFNEQLQQLVIQAAEQPNMEIGRLMVADRSPQATVIPMTPTKDVLQLLAGQVIETRDNVALQDDHITLKYGELAANINWQVTRLAALGIDDEDVVVILAKRDIRLPVAILAVLSCGAVYTCIDANTPQQRISELLDVCNAKAVVSFGEDNPRVMLPQLVVDELSRGRCEKLTLRKLPKPGGPACITFTSGSTGIPKAVVGSHGALTSHLRHQVDRFGWSAGDRFSMLGGLANDPLQRDIFNPLCIGAQVIVPDENVLSPQQLRDWLIRKQVSVCHLTPPLAKYVTSCLGGSGTLLALRWVLFAGDKLYWQDVAAMRSVAPHCGIANLYGTTESQRSSTEWICLEPHERIDQKKSGPVPIGRFGPGCELLVLDHLDRQSGTFQLGELYIAGDFLALGYIDGEGQVEALSRTVTLDGQIKTVYGTGDLGRKLADGSIAVLGRSDNQINLNGYRISLDEIERAAMAAAPLIACKVLFDPQLEQIRCYFQAAEPVAIASLRETMANLLPRYMVPASWVAVDDLPLTASGKVDTGALRKLSIAAKCCEVGEPFDSTEQIIADIWSECLRLDNIFRQASFFALGGNSITALALSERLQSHTGTAYPLDKLYRQPTLQDCLDFYETLGAEKVETVVWQSNCYPDSKPFPMTPVQQAYWLGRSGSFALGNISTSAYVEMKMTDPDGPIRCDKVEAVVNRLIARHPMLRMSVTDVGLQRIQDDVGYYQVQFCHFQGDKDPALLQLRQQMSESQLDPKRWPLFELRLSGLPSGEAILHAKIDLLLMDYWSGQVLMAEFTEMYLRPRQSLAPLAAKFSDYIGYVQRRRQSKAYSSAQSYWQARLDDLVPPQLPLIKVPTSIARAKFTRREFVIPRELWCRGEDACRLLGVTPSTLLIAAFGKLLGVWTQQEKMTINLTLFDRPSVHEHINRLVGDFTSLLLLVVDCQPTTFEQCVLEVQRQLFSDLQHLSYSGVDVLRDIARNRNQSSALMPVVFTNHLGLSSTLHEDRHRPELMKQVYRESRSSQVWLDHVVGDCDQGVSMVWNTIDELFPDGLIDSMFFCYQQFVEGLLQNSDRWADPVRVDIPRADKALVAAVNQTQVDYSDALIHSGFVRQVEKTPLAIALVVDGIQYSYGQLWQRAMSVSIELIAKNISPGQLVAVVMDKSIEQVSAVLGVVMAGAAYLPIDPQLHSTRIEQLLSQAMAAIVLVDAQSVSSVECVARDHLITVGPKLLQKWLDNGQPDISTIRANYDDLAYVIFTSGSTGVPKGVAIEHRAAVNTIQAINNLYEMDENDRIFGISALSFDLSVYDIFGTLSAGATLVLPTRSQVLTPAQWPQLLREHRISVWNSVPALMQIMVDSAEVANVNCMSFLRLVMLSGDWIPLSLPEQIHRFNESIRLYSLGGATEASIWSIHYPIDNVESDWQSIPYGKALPNQQIYVLDRQLQLCPTHARGDIYIGGKGLAREYLGDSGKTAASFVINPHTGQRLYRTGDMGRLLPNGNVEFLGRADQQVKINGYRIELGEVESALLSVPGVEQAVVLVNTAITGRYFLTAFIIGSIAEQPSPKEGACLLNQAAQGVVSKRLAEKLPTYMYPKYLLLLAQLPLTNNGKVDRQQLSVLQDEAITIESSSEVVPLSQLARQVAPIWMELLGSDQLHSGNANFFELGGNSMLALQCLNRVNDQFGVALSIEVFYQTCTLNAFAEEIGQLRLDQALVKIRQQPSQATQHAIFESGEL